MKGRATSEFWSAFERLSNERQKIAREAFRRWQGNPFHPSLHFKQIAGSSGLVSARAGRGWRVLGIRKDDVVIWFWIGSHREYEKLIERV